NESRLQVITFVILFALGSLGTAKHLGAALYGIFHLLFDFLPLFGGVQWTHQSAGLQAIANADFFRLFDQLFHKGVGDIIEQIETFDCQASLAAVKETSHRGGADGALKIGIITNDHGVATAQFQSHVLEVFGGGLHNPSSGICGTGEADLTHDGIHQQLLANHAAGTSDDVENALGAAGVHNRFVDQFAAAEIGERRCACRLHNNSIAGQERGAEFVAHEGNRKVPRYNGATDSQRFAQNQTVTAVIEDNGSGPQALRHAPVMIQCMNETADLQNRLAHRFSLFAGQ